MAERVTQEDKRLCVLYFLLLPCLLLSRYGLSFLCPNPPFFCSAVLRFLLPFFPSSFLLSHGLFFWLFSNPVVLQVKAITKLPASVLRKELLDIDDDDDYIKVGSPQANRRRKEEEEEEEEEENENESFLRERM